MQENIQQSLSPNVEEKRQRYTQSQNNVLVGQDYQMSSYDEEFINAVAQRLAQRLLAEQELQVKGRAPSTGQRLWLAIVSLVVFLSMSITIFAIAAAIAQAWIGLLVTLIVAIAVCIVNIVFNTSHR